jgi:hypothetical protein
MMFVHACLQVYDLAEINCIALVSRMDIQWLESEEHLALSFPEICCKNLCLGCLTP